MMIQMKEFRSRKEAIGWLLGNGFKQDDSGKWVSKRLKAIATGPGQSGAKHKVKVNWGVTESTSSRLEALLEGLNPQKPKSAEEVVAASDASGELVAFKVKGKWFDIKRKSRTSYVMTGSDSTGRRARWGTRREILADVKHVLRTGSLPMASSGW